MRVDNKTTLRQMERNAVLEPYMKDKFKRNKLIANFALTVFGSFDILDYPVCPKCECLAMWDIDGIYCENCGHSKEDGVLTFREYIDREIVKK